MAQVRALNAAYFVLRTAYFVHRTAGNPQVLALTTRLPRIII